MEQKILTLAEKWEIDAQAYREGASARTSSPQCEKCRYNICLLYTSPSPRDMRRSRMPSSA